MFVSDPPQSLGEFDPSEVPLERLEREIEAHAARANADMCRWLELVAEFERRSGWNNWGCLSCAHWVAWRCSFSLRSAREHVRVARCLEKLPLIHAEFAAGRLSYSKVRALSRVADGESEPQLLELSSHATAAQLDLLIRSYSRASAVAAGEIHRNRYVTWIWNDDGSLSLHANLPPEDGATVIAALEAAAERLRDEQDAWDEDAEVAQDGSAEPRQPEEDGSAEPLRGRVSRADALVSIATDSMCPTRLASKPADRNMVVVHVDASTLAVNDEGRCHVREGSGLPAETARRIACDSSVVTLLERDGEPLSVGRRTRSIPPSMRRAVEARDQGCRFPGCHNKRYVDAHHIEHWASGGETRVDNLLTLCRRHHRLVHEGGYSITDNGGGDVTFRRPDGSELRPVPAPLGALSDPSPLLLEIERPTPGPLRVGGGDKMNLDYAVLAMFQICERSARAGPD